MNFRTRDNRVYHSSLGSFQEVKGYIQDYLTLLEKKAFMDEDKTELYLLFSSCLEVRAPPPAPPRPPPRESSSARSQNTRCCVLCGVKRVSNPELVPSAPAPARRGESRPEVPLHPSRRCSAPGAGLRRRSAPCLCVSVTSKNPKMRMERVRLHPTFSSWFVFVPLSCP